MNLGFYYKNNAVNLNSTEHWVGFVAKYQLGNQLWELASTHGIAKARKARWCYIGVSEEYLSYLQWIVEPPEECPGTVWINPYFWYTPQLKAVGEDGLYASYNKKIIDSSFPRIRVDGFLQSFKYFDKQTPVPFKLAAAPNADAWIKTRNITVAIHIRRGDKFLDVGNIVPSLLYFKKALDMLNLLFPVSNRRFVVVTDDPSWVYAHPFFNGMHVLSSSDLGFDMAVISACEHKILSIGTFGWWGAYLNDPGHNRTSAIIYPTLQMAGFKMFGFNHTEYFPSHWIGIEY